MEQFNLSDTKTAYLCVIERDEKGYGGYALDVSSHVFNKGTREEVINSLREGMALSLYWHEVYGEPLPQSHSREEDVTFESPDDETVWLTPKAYSSISAALGRAMHKRKLSQSELARRLGVSRQAVNRLVNPFYFGHSIVSLQNFARAVNADLAVGLELR